MHWSMKRGLKSDLIVRFIAVVAITTLISCVMGTLLINKWTIGQAESRIGNSLNTAREVLNNRLEHITNTVRFASSSNRLLEALHKKDWADLQRYLEKVRGENALDILDVADAHGYVMFRASNPGSTSDSIALTTTVGLALTSGKTISSVEYVPYQTMEKEGEELAARCVINPPSSTAAMVLMSASPILKDGKVAGVVWGGVVLNRNEGIVDKIEDIVYQNEKYRGKDNGLATLFLKDMRISTNYKNSGRDQGHRLHGRGGGHAKGAR